MDADRDDRALVWSTYEGLGFERFILEVRGAQVRLITPSLRARILQQLPVIPLFFAFFGPLVPIVLFVRDGRLIVASVLVLLVLVVAGLVFFGTHVWAFMVVQPKTAVVADVVEVKPRVIGLKIRLRIHRVVPTPTYIAPAAPSGGYFEDRWVIVGSRRRVWKALGGLGSRPKSR